MNCAVCFSIVLVVLTSAQSDLQGEYFLSDQAAKWKNNYCLPDSILVSGNTSSLHLEYFFDISYLQSHSSCDWIRPPMRDTTFVLGLHDDSDLPPIHGSGRCEFWRAVSDLMEPSMKWICTFGKCFHQKHEKDHPFLLDCGTKIGSDVYSGFYSQVKTQEKSTLH